MNEKLARIGAKAGLGESEIKGFVRLGLSGLVAVLLSFFAGSAQAGESGKAGPAQLDVKPRVKEDLPEKCRLKPDGGTCKAFFERYYFDPRSGECRKFFYGGCDGVVPFETREECEQECFDRSVDLEIPTDSGGPFPGYPVGTKYYTVSVADF
jgi:hypothetical protein